MIWDSLAAVSFSQCPVPTPRALQGSQAFTHSKEKGENPVKDWTGATRAAIEGSFWVWEVSLGFQLGFIWKLLTLFE